MIIKDIDIYAKEHTTPESQELCELAEYTQENVPNPQMLCGRVEGQLLKLLLINMRAKKVLELGTYTGYSALFMAQALPDDGYVVTCDHNAKALEIAKQFIEKNPHGHKVRIVQSEAKDLLENLIQKNEMFDFIFIDANKKSNEEYVNKCLELLQPEGMIAIDNTLYGEEVLNPKESISKSIANMNDNLVKRTDLEIVFLTVRDGITLVRRKT